MNVFKMAAMLFKNNIYLYKFYLMVLTVTVAIYYNFLAIVYNPYMDVMNEQYEYAKIGSMMGSIILFFTVLSFMLHANHFFYKQRFKEIGTYQLMGIRTTKIGLVFATESIFVGSIALGGGSIIGIAFSKLFFMLLAKAMILDTAIPFYIPPKAIIALISLLGSIIMILAIKNYWEISRSKLIDMLQATKKEQALPRLRWVRGILGVSCIGVGYGFASQKGCFDKSLIILLLVCVGTYFFFESFLVIVLQKLINNKKLIYKGSRLISFNHTLFRLGGHYRNYAMTAILCGATLAAAAGSMGMKEYANKTLLMEAPYSISYINSDSTINKKILDTIESSGHEVCFVNQVEFIDSTITHVTQKHEREEKVFVTAYSEIDKTLRALKVRNYEKILEDIKPKEGEISKTIQAMLTGSNYEGDTYRLANKNYSLKRELRIPFIGEFANFGRRPVCIVTDKDFENLKEHKNPLILNGINITRPSESLELIYTLAGIVPGGTDNLNTYIQEYEYKYYLIGVLYFLGIIMAIVFLVATFSTLYFKILGDALYDREQYRRLIKIGITRQELVRSIRTQIGISFLFPTLLGMLHGIMAIKALGNLMNFNFVNSISIGMLIFTVILVIFYEIIARQYTQVVCKGEN